jgi:hypothetical protein
MNYDALVVRSHVGRDFQQSAALFKTDKQVVWEYVSNGLQYTDPGINPVVNVTLDSKARKIIVADNGRGMDRSGLANFFKMHGENQDRKAGRKGRGMFGTGKCAAFGIADQLRVSSVRNGKRNIVELVRSQIEAAGEDCIPVTILERDARTDQPNGTVVEISGIKIRKLDQRGVTSFIERHLAHYRNKPLVLVNSYECQFDDPPISQTRTIVAEGEIADKLGRIALTLKVAKAPLDSEMQGVAIYANDVWLETTLAGCEGQPRSQEIFGEIDVPSLDDDRSPIPAFDMSRSMQLNRSNELVQTLLAFIGREVDKLRRELVRQDEARRATEESRRLEREASKIAELINQDFQEFSARIARVHAKGGRGRDLIPSASDEASDPRIVPGDRLSVTLRRNNVHDSAPGPKPPPLPNPEPSPPRPPTEPILMPDENGDLKGKVNGTSSRSKRHRGGFNVDFDSMGEENPRATYRKEDRTIYVNLDHPQIAAAKGRGSVEEPTFRRLAYEVAFAEYAIALAIEFEEHDEYIEPSEPIFDIRETLNRMAKRAASLYAI